MSARRALGLAIGLLLGLGRAGAEPLGHEDWNEWTERQMFDRAGKVLLARVVQYGGFERPPDVSPSRQYRYQALWLKDVEVFKGPAQPERWGYEVVLLPVRNGLHPPPRVFPRPVDRTTWPPDEDVLVYMAKDPTGAWTVLDGTGGVWRYPGRARLENLRKWAKQPPGK